MSRRRRGRRVHLKGIMGQAAKAVQVIRRDPLRAGLTGSLCVLLLWIILTKSLPYALAPVQPDVALALNPRNPIALITTAEALKKRLVALATAESGHVQADGEKHENDLGNSLSKLPASQDSGSGAEPVGQREILRASIRDLALRTIAEDPLNAQAFRLLAEVKSDPEQIRELMQQSAARSRHEAEAVFWLLNDSFYHRRYRKALDYANTLLHAHTELAAYVHKYLALVAEDPEGRRYLTNRLALGPDWRNQFFGTLPQNCANLDTPLVLFLSLQDLGKPVSQEEIAPYINFLISKGHADLAYNAWLRLIPASRQDGLSLLVNASFENKPSGLPFDWQIQKGVNALAEIVRLEGKEARNALHIGFGDGRVQFPEVSQIVMLPPGRYRFEGKLRGVIAGARGLRWQFQCLPTKRVLSETEMLLGRSQQWRIFTLEAEVPQLNECRGQAIRLFHDSRSPSEELLSGEVWFADLRLERISEISR